MSDEQARAPAWTPPERLAMGIATLGGIGYVPYAPGTWGTAATLPVAWGVAAVGSGWFSVAAVLLVTAAAIPAAAVAERLLGRKDAGPVVIDEAAGFLVTMLFLPAGPGTLSAGFFLFRFFDVAKVFPADRAERLPGGAGIVLDDVVAGVYANLALRLTIFVWPAIA